MAVRARSGDILTHRWGLPSRADQELWPGVISAALLSIKQSFALSQGLQEITVVAVLLGAIIGVLGSGPVVDVLGRRRTLRQWCDAEKAKPSRYETKIPTKGRSLEDIWQSLRAQARRPVRPAPPRPA